MIETEIIVLLSLAFGSFANNVISYYVNSSRFDLLHSTCFCGKKKLKFIELIPIISFVLQKGKCTECSERISIRYPLVEILTVGIGLLVYHLLGLEIRTVVIFLILYVLMMISIVDYYRLIIPNILTIVLLALVSILLFINSEPILTRIAISLSITLILFGVQYLFKKIKNKDGLGTGDIKLVFVLSLLLNLTDSMIAIWISSLIGLLTITLLNIHRINQLKEIKIPFGLYLSIGFTFVILWNLKFDISGLENLIASLWQMN
ncbi:MAG: prepilin peptidase [Ignavibacterium sp.]|nr:prepilin peptidase [Ignavibacterium sp.]